MQSPKLSEKSFNVSEFLDLSSSGLVFRPRHFRSDPHKGIPLCQHAMAVTGESVDSVFGYNRPSS